MRWCCLERYPTHGPIAITHTHTHALPAGIYLMRVAGLQGSWVQRVQVAGPLSPPSTLQLLPSPSGQGTSYMFVGSQVSNSQVLALNASIEQLGAAGPDGPPPKWQLVDSALIKSLAPVQDCVVVPDSQQADDKAMLVASGVAPFGRLARAKLGMALEPYAGGGPDIPVSDTCSHILHDFPPSLLCEMGPGILGTETHRRTCDYPPPIVVSVCVQARWTRQHWALLSVPPAHTLVLHRRVPKCLRWAQAPTQPGRAATRTWASLSQLPTELM